MGANNILGTVLDFEVKWSQVATYQDLERKGAANAWLPSHFANEYDTLVSKIRAINAKHVIFVTVPHVTIVPMVRGIGNKMPGDRYFARYTRPWITDAVFSPNRHPCLTGNELRAIDWAIDQYNNHIVNIVRSERLDQALKVPGAPRTDWRVVDLAGLLDRLAYRRYLLDEEARPEWWTPYELPAAYQELSPQPDSRFYVSDRFGRNQGGLFAPRRRPPDDHRLRHHRQRSHARNGRSRSGDGDVRTRLPQAARQGHLDLQTARANIERLAVRRTGRSLCRPLPGPPPPRPRLRRRLRFCDRPPGPDGPFESFLQKCLKSRTLCADIPVRRIGSRR